MREVTFRDSAALMSVLDEAGLRDVAQPGSAPEWGSGGRGFKSRRPDLLEGTVAFELTAGTRDIVDAGRLT